MADDKVSYDQSVGAKQRELWESTVVTLAREGRPNGKAFSGGAAAAWLQPEFDGFVAKVNELFDDNRELADLISSVMAGHEEKMRVTDAAGAEAVTP